MAWFENIEWQRTDLASSTITVKMTDGRVVSGALDKNEFPTEFGSWTLFPGRCEIVFTTADGVEMEIELFDGESSDTRRNGRPIVYLDQNKWSEISKVLNDSRRSTSPQDPVLRLVEAARAGEILVPLSAGHFVETGPLFAEPRIRIATKWRRSRAAG